MGVTSQPDPYIRHRLLIYTATLCLHIGNLLAMNANLSGEPMKNAHVKAFAAMQSRFFTCWTFFLQIVYALTALISDLLVLMNSQKNNYQLPKYLRGFRETLFCGIVFPTSLLVFSVFWSLYTYDRSLILPTFADLVLTKTSNHIIHTAIVPVVLLEVFYRPRYTPKSHFKNVSHLAFHMLLYLGVILYTKLERDLWLYPIFHKTAGTIVFPIVIITIASLVFLYYYFQWYLNYMRWGSKPKESEKKR